jgi:hypothetical protein
MWVELKGLHRVIAKGHTYYYAKRGRGGPRMRPPPSAAPLNSWRHTMRRLRYHRHDTLCER